jgi:hypothetical protein
MIIIPFHNNHAVPANIQSEEGIKGVVRFNHQGFEISIENLDHFPSMSIYRGETNVTRMFFESLEVEGTPSNIAIAVQRINEYVG